VIKLASTIENYYSHKFGKVALIIIALTLTISPASSEDYPLFTEEGGLESFETEDFTITSGLESVGTDWMVLEGEVTDFGPVNESVDFGFEYRIKNEEEWSYIKSEELKQDDTFYSQIEGLETDTRYEFRAVSEEGTRSETSEAVTLEQFSESGGLQSFETENFSVETLVADELTTESFRLRGDVSDLGDLEEPIDFGFEYRENETDEWNEVFVKSKTSDGTFETTIEGLEEETFYEYRAKNLGQGVEGEVREKMTLAKFTESGGLESFETEGFSIFVEAGDFGVDWMVLEGEVTDFGPSEEPIDFKFRYREKGEDEWRETSSTQLESDGNYSEKVEDLEENTVYEIKAVSEADIKSDKIEKKTVEQKTSEGGIVPFEHGDEFLQWTYETDVDGFRVYSDENSNDFEMIQEVEDPRNKNETGFAGVSAESESTACYYVTVFKEEDGETLESEPTDEACREW